MERSDSRRERTRRGVLRAGGTAVGGMLLAGAASPVAAQSGGDFGGWFDDVDNYDGVVDATGQSEVTVEVGVQNGDGPYGFGPAAVRVDPGTTVVWEWTGEGGSHNVVAKDGGFKSELVAEAGHTFSHTFEEQGTFKYLCEPHESLGMKGAVVVRQSDDGGTGSPEPVPAEYGDWFDGVENFEGTVDATGQSEVTVEVGVQNGDGAFGFGPAAVRVDPGTTVVWEWTGEGGSHNVVAKDGGFKSELVAEAGHTFSHTFEERGVFEYYCEPHRSLGMKGAVVVGPAPAAAGEASGETTGIVLTDLYVLGSLALGVGAFTYALRGAIEQRREAERVHAGERATEAPAEEPAVELGAEYDPVGTATLVAGYFLLVALLWVFMYFVEFLGGPSITG